MAPAAWTVNKKFVSLRHTGQTSRGYALCHVLTRYGWLSPTYGYALSLGGHRYGRRLGHADGVYVLVEFHGSLEHQDHEVVGGRLHVVGRVGDDRGDSYDLGRVGLLVSEVVAELPLANLDRYFVNPKSAMIINGSFEKINYEIFFIAVLNETRLIC